MKAISYFLCVLVSVSCSAFASDHTLTFSQSTDGTVFAVYVSGACPLGLNPSQGNAPTVTINAGQIDISSYGAVYSYFGTGVPPCNPQASPGYMLPASLGKLPDGHYTVVWSFSSKQISGAFDVASGSLVTANGGVANSSAVSGLWYDPLYTGSGFNLLMSKAGFLVTYNGWDANGNRLWLISDTGPTSLSLNAPVVLNMSYSAEGIFSRPQLKPVLWGSLVLNFTSCQTATASLAGKDGIQNLSLTQLAGIAGLPGC